MLSSDSVISVIFCFISRWSIFDQLGQISLSGLQINAQALVFELKKVWLNL